MNFFRSGFLHWSNMYRSNNKAFEYFRFCSWIRRLIRIFLHSAVTQLTMSLIPRQISQCLVRLLVSWVIEEWDYTSTESTRNDEIFINVGAFCVDSVDMESHSALTQLTVSLTLCRLRVRIKPNHAYLTSSGAFKGIGFRKIYDEMFIWDQY